MDSFQGAFTEVEPCDWRWRFLWDGAELITRRSDVGSVGSSAGFGSGMKATETDEVANALPRDSTLSEMSPFHCLYWEAKMASLGNLVGFASSTNSEVPRVVAIGTGMKDRNSVPVSRCCALPFDGRMVFLCILGAFGRRMIDRAAMAATALLSWPERLGRLKAPGLLWDRLPAIILDGDLTILDGHL